MDKQKTFAFVNTCRYLVRGIIILFDSLENISAVAENYYICSPNELDASYERSRLAGISIKQKEPKVTLSHAQLIPHVKLNTQLLTITDRLIYPIISISSNKTYFFILCNYDLVTLKLYASEFTLKLIEKNGIKRGIVFSEESCGTNALAFAKEKKSLITIKAKQHYSNFLKDYWFAAGPIKNMEDKIIAHLAIAIPVSLRISLAVELIKTLIVAMERELFLFSLDLKEIKYAIPLPQKIQKVLTPRELEIYQLLLNRLPSKIIANKLCLSVSTVRTHRKNIYKKLNVNGLDGLISKFNFK